MSQYHRDLGITLLDAKYLDPACHKGCQGLIHKHEIERLEDKLQDARRTCAELVTDGNAVTLGRSVQRLSAENAKLREENQRLTQAIAEMPDRIKAEMDRRGL